MKRKPKVTIARRPLSLEPADNEMTRTGVAKCLGCSVATVRRMEGKDLRPRVGPDGVHYFRKSDVNKLALRYVPGRERNRVEQDRHEEREGKLAARVFELVKRLEIVPRRVIDLVGQWNEMRLPPTVQAAFKPNGESARRGDDGKSERRGSKRP